MMAMWQELRLAWREGEPSKVCSQVNQKLESEGLGLAP